VLLLDEMRVYESGRFEITYTNMDTATSSVIDPTGVLKCELNERNYFVTLDSPEK
jgi:hypothetical protein